MNLRLLFLVIVSLILGDLSLFSQCGTNNITGDLIINSNQSLSGTYNVSGTFSVASGVIVTVAPYSSGSCGALVVNASVITVSGTINGDYAGRIGGNGGALQTTGYNDDRLITCDNTTNPDSINVSGGRKGFNGAGTGAGLAGVNGQNGYGPKQDCNFFDDDVGLVGGAGGAGGGAGGSYAAKGGNGGKGGDGKASVTIAGASCMNLPTGTAVFPGPGGNGGVAGNSYGAISNENVLIGSGGGGSGSGGRSGYIGASGSVGGNGGGKILLNATSTMTITGSLTAKGQVGGNGGKGGNGSISDDCCSDGTQGCNEFTYSGGAGGGAGAGGGSGGGIMLKALGEMNITGTLNASGGNGGNGGSGGNASPPCPQNSCNQGPTEAGEAGENGGAGSGGRVKIFFNPCWANNTISPITNVAAGTGNGIAGSGTYYNSPGIGLTAISTSFSNIVDVNCFGSGDGSFNFNVSGGVTPYTYAWSNGATLQDLTSLDGDTYTVTVTDKNGCQVIDSVEIDEPTEIQIALTPTDLTCFQNSSGEIDASVSGGTPNYTYAWSNSSTSSNPIGLASGLHTVTVTDGNTCTKTDTISLNEPADLVLITESFINCGGTGDDSASVQVSGGTPNYTFLWSDVNNQTTQTALNLVSGNYTVTVTDDNTCEKTQTVIVEDPVNMLIAFTETKITCNGESDGAIQATVTNGKAPLSYLWNNLESSSFIDSLASGVYTISVTDSNNCQIVDSFDLQQPEIIQVIADTIIDAKCFGNCDGQIKLLTTGGTQPYTYNWDNAPVQTDSNQTNLCEGTYLLFVEDVNFCQTSQTFDVGQPTAIQSGIITSKATVCGKPNGEVSVDSIYGGVPPYQYVWGVSAGGQTTPTAVNVKSGSHIVFIYDSTGCVGLDTAFVASSDKFKIIHEIVQHDTCGAAIGAIKTIVQSGGTKPYIYEWDDAKKQSTVIAKNLPEGVYWVYVTDSLGCKDSTVSQINSVFPIDVSLSATPTKGWDPLEVEFTTSNSGIVDSLIWDLVDTQFVDKSSFIKYLFTISGEKMVKITGKNAGGCSDIDSVLIVVDASSKIIIPTVFTPNDDGVNDIFKVEAPGMKSFEVAIFNRWGDEIISWQNFAKASWDGRTKSGIEVPAGVYYYVITGEGNDTETYLEKGYVQLIR